jgi:hypothetical protein
MEGGQSFYYFQIAVTSVHRLIVRVKGPRDSIYVLKTQKNEIFFQGEIYGSWGKISVWL